MPYWRKLKEMILFSKKGVHNIQNIEDKLDFPFLESLKLCILYSIKVGTFS